ncbi:MAG: hypothetical protein LBS88_10325 [Tannerellaceae bacterium]|nr:hypothetical protein [Tannerellaceae bacterium]
MKVLSVILSIYITILSTIAYCPDTCMAGSEIHTGHTTENSPYSCADCCSPFTRCNTCAGFTPGDSISLSSQLQEIPAEANTYLSLIYTPPFLRSVWQPPKPA